MNKLISTALTSAALASVLVTQASAQAPVLQGEWTSVAPEAQGKIFVMRHFHFDGNQWGVLYHAFGDAQAKVPLFTLDVGGVFVIGGPSATVPGAYDGVFPATHRKIIADSDAGVGMFAGMGCALKVGEPKALVSEPCGFVPSQMTAMGEYDLVMTKDNKVFFGDRSGDLSKARPTTLYPFPLVQK